MKIQVSENDSRLIDAILDHVKVPGRHRMQIEISMRACHLNGCPLDLPRMVKAGMCSDVVHDVYGIDANVCRDTGKLKNCFHPRFAKEQ